LEIEDETGCVSERFDRHELAFSGLLEEAQFHMALRIQLYQRTALVARQKFELFEGHAASRGMPGGGHDKGSGWDLKTLDKLSELWVGPRRPMDAECDSVDLRP
jgi:hypothetical protein